MPIPTLHNTRYFQAASSAASSPLKPTRKAVARVVDAMPNQSAPNVCARTTSSIELQKAPSRMKYTDLRDQKTSPPVQLIENRSVE